MFMLCFIIRHGDIQYTVKAERPLFIIVPCAAFCRTNRKTSGLFCIPDPM